MNPEEACALDAQLGNRSVLIYPRSAPEVPIWLKGQLFLYISLVNVWLERKTFLLLLMMMMIMMMVIIIIIITIIIIIIIIINQRWTFLNLLKYLWD